MVYLDPDPISPKTTELYVSMEQEKTLPNQSHEDPRIIPPHEHLLNFLDFWIFCEGLGVPHPQGWGSRTPP